MAEQAEAEALAKAVARDQNRTNSLSARVDHRGRIRLAGELDPEAWATVSAALEPFARPGGLPAPDHDQHGGAGTRTAGQRQADALVEICRRTLAAPETPTSFGFPAHIAITIDHDQLLKRPLGLGTLDTGTPISAADIRRLACDATIIPVLLNSNGVPLDVGRAIRVFTKELRRAVKIRDRGCAFPGCDRPPAWCNVHHIVHWLFGGSTSLDNGVLLCHAHHVVIHRAEWTVRLGREQTARVHPTRLGRPRSHTPHQHPPPQTLRT